MCTHPSSTRMHILYNSINELQFHYNCKSFYKTELNKSVNSTRCLNKSMCSKGNSKFYTKYSGIQKWYDNDNTSFPLCLQVIIERIYYFWSNYEFAIYVRNCILSRTLQFSILCGNIFKIVKKNCINLEKL